jgi:hypothetical protein
MLLVWVTGGWRGGKGIYTVRVQLEFQLYSSERYRRNIALQYIKYYHVVSTMSGPVPKETALVNKSTGPACQAGWFKYQYY